MVGEYLQFRMVNTVWSGIADWGNSNTEAGGEKEASVIGNEVKELKRQLKEAKQAEKQNLKEEKKERKEQQKLERQRFREEERMRKVQMQEERELKKELDKTEPAKEKHVVRMDTSIE